MRSMDISNGEGVGVALFVQGCHFHCPNCFNSETWSFNDGKEWTVEVKSKFLELVDRPYIKRVSILGGEPLAEENIDDVLDLVTEINKRYNTPQDRVCVKDKNNNILTDFSDKIRLSSPQKSIWLYTGYEWKHIFDQQWHYHPKTQEKLSIGRWRRQQIISKCDVLVDGTYVDSKHDITLRYRGSKNQNLIDVTKTLEHGDIVLWDK